jgi:hypothetical protein
MPKRAVLLIVAPGQPQAAGFGFLQFPTVLLDLNGREVMKTGMSNRWGLQSFVDSPDKRYRKIVRRFGEAGYLELEKDEFATSKR